MRATAAASCRHRLVAVLLGLCLSACGPRYPRPGTAVNEPRLEDTVFVPRDGAHLPLHRWAVAGRLRGIVLCLHSYGDYGESFAALGPALAADGFEVLAPDLRGFGGAADAGRWPGTRAFIDDLADLVGAAGRGRPTGVPIWILGESLGGGIALATAGSQTLPGVRGLVLAAPAVREAIPFRYGWNVGLWGLATVLPGHEVDIHQAGPDLTAAAAQRLRADPLVQQRIRLDSYYGLIRLVDAASDAAARVRLPVLLLYGTADSSVRAVSICALTRALKGPLTTRIYPGGIHRILHQAGLQPVVTDAVRAFLDGHEVSTAGTEHLSTLCKGDDGGG